ncbi:MAG: rRNA adenine N-6-methyltransferase family protein [Nanobdellota archaeon]
MNSNEVIKYDQHFMTDKNILNNIALFCNFEEINEIGPGKGYLTEKLIKKSNVIAIEKDPQLTKYLEKKFISEIKKNQLEIKNIDVLDNNVKLLPHLFSNLPYSISEPFLFKIIRHEVKEAYLVTGKYFLKRIQGNGKLGIIAKEIFQIKKLQEIPKQSFNPPPRKESVFFCLKEKQKTPLSHIYKQFDKKLKNALEDYFTAYMTKKQFKKKLERIEIKILSKNRIDNILKTKIRQIKNNDFKYIKNIFDKINSEDQI